MAPLALDKRIQVELELTRHGMAAGMIVDVEAIAPDGASQQLLAKAKGTVSLKDSLPARDTTMSPLKPTARR